MGWKGGGAFIVWYGDGDDDKPAKVEPMGRYNGHGSGGNDKAAKVEKGGKNKTITDTTGVKKQRGGR